MWPPGMNRAVTRGPKRSQFGRDSERSTAQRRIKTAMRSFAALVLLGGVSAWGAVKEAPVTLFVDTSEIEGAPQNQLVVGSAFELRFNEPMVADDAVGKPGSDAPIVLKPAIAGTWTWVSGQSGVYQLTEPPALGSS